MSNEKPHLNNLRFNNAQLRVMNLTSRSTSHAYHLELVEGEWPDKSKLEEFFKDVYRSPSIEPDVEVTFYDRDCFIHIQQ
jgi:hypothetical protein